MCHKFDCEIVGLSKLQENASFTEYIDSVMKIREVQATIDNQLQHLQQVQEEMHWFVISGGTVELIQTQYKPIIEELKNEIGSLQKTLQELQSNTNLEKGI